MSASRDETDRLRYQTDDLERDATQAPTEPDTGAVSFLGQTGTVSAYPTTAQAFYAITVMNVFGSEVEGTAATTATLTGTIYAWNCGSAIPPNGTKRIITGVPYRWVFQYDG